MKILSLLIISLFCINISWSTEIIYKTYKPLKIKEKKGVKIRYKIIKPNELETITIKDKFKKRTLYPVIYAKTKTSLSKISTAQYYIKESKKLYNNKKTLLDKVITDIISPRKEQKVKIPTNRIALISTGANIEDIMTYNSMLIRKYQKIFPKSTTLYGEANKNKADILVLEKKKLLLKPADFKVDGQFSTPNFSQVVDSHDLLFIFGHGSKKGMPLWKQTGQNKEYFSPKEKDFSKTVMINTNCYGGIFAKKVKCGFFSAHPSYPSSGCWVNPKDKVVNYAEEFFKSMKISKEKTLEQLHWEASYYGSPHDVTYSSLDAYAEIYTKELKKEVSWKEALKWARGNVTNEELIYLKSLSKDNQRFNLGDKIYYPMSVKGLAKKDIAESLKNSERDGIRLCKGKECDYYKDYYRKLLAVKRIYVKKVKPQDNRYKEISSCSKQKINELYNGT